MKTGDDVRANLACEKLARPVTFVGCAPGLQHKLWKQGLHWSFHEDEHYQNESPLLLFRPSLGKWIYAWMTIVLFAHLIEVKEVILLALTRISLRNRPRHGWSSSYLWPDQRKIGHWSPRTVNSPVRSFCLILSKTETFVIWSTKESWLTRDRTSLHLRGRGASQLFHDGNPCPLSYSGQ